MFSPAKAVLFADDDINDRYLMLEACKDAGIRHPLVMVEDGEEVIHYLNGAGKYGDRALYPIPCLAVLDLSMPRKSGFDALRWIRESPQWRSLRVVILSASAQPRDVALAYELGACAYIMKPSTAEELIALAAAINSFWLRFAESPP